MLSEANLDKLRRFKSFRRAERASLGRRVKPSIALQLATTSQLNPNSNIAKHPPKHLTSTTMDWHKFLESANISQLRGRR